MAPLTKREPVFLNDLSDVSVASMPFSPTMFAGLAFAPITTPAAQAYQEVYNQDAVSTFTITLLHIEDTECYVHFF